MANAAGQRDDELRVSQGGQALTPKSFRLSGVQRIEALTLHTTLRNRLLLFLSLLLAAFAYGLDILLRDTYKQHATSTFGEHSLLGTVSVVKSVIAAVAQPMAARVADVFGRFELIVVSIVFYTLGTIIEATGGNVAVFAVGSVLNKGYTCIVLLVEVVIADTTTLRTRLLFSYLPPLPYLANAWIGGSIVDRVSEMPSSWRWGLGMWAIIFPLSCIPLLVSLWWVNHKAKKAGALKHIRTPFQQHGIGELMKALYWQLDAVGLFLMTIVLGCILVPLTLSNSTFQGDRGDLWAHPHILIPIVIGFITIPVFVLWEKTAPYPLLPLQLLKDRAVWGALGIAITFNFAFSTQFDYLWSILAIAYDETDTAATRISNLYAFVSVFTGILLGLVVYKVRFLKPFIMFGTFVWWIAFAMMIFYRGGSNPSQHNGIIAAQVLLGVGGGFFPYPALASIQAATKHDNLAVVTSLYLSSYSIGSALGNCLSAAIWTSTLPNKLRDRLGNELGSQWYKSPIDMERQNPMGTQDREVVVAALRDIQRFLCIAGVCVSVFLSFFAIVIRNPRLPDEQSIPKHSVTDAEMAEMTRTEVMNARIRDGQRQGY